MRTEDFDYELGAEFIAQVPAEPRDSSKLLVLHRETDRVSHDMFYNVGKYLTSGDVLVLNRTRVIPARIYARKIPTGGKVEILLLRKVDELIWQVMVGGKRIGKGKMLEITQEIQAEVIEDLDNSVRLLRFNRPIEAVINSIGTIPLPPYITTPLRDTRRYQTVYADEPGSAAAPTAGLHFTPELMEALSSQGIIFVTTTLHIGLDTFLPVNEENPADHVIHTEWGKIGEQECQVINRAHRRGSKVIAVGTTSVRLLETAAQYAKPGEVVGSFEGFTDLFILPGYQFRAVDAMITNFHLPRSTLLMLVSAFAGRERILRVYELAKQHGYRFYSFGDAMLIL